MKRRPPMLMAAMMGILASTMQVESYCVRPEPDSIQPTETPEYIESLKKRAQAKRDRKANRV